MAKDSVFEFDNIATNIFGPLYPVVAEQIKKKTSVTEGICMDIGSCGGHLGVAFANITNTKVILFDKDLEALEIAQTRISNLKLSNRMDTLLGDVHNIPLGDETLDIAISRGSIWFWQDQLTALKEIYRVLKKGGCAYIGGGFGNKALKKEIDVKMIKKNPNWLNKRKGFIGDNCSEKFINLLKEANIEDYEIIDDESGLWIYFKKLI